LTASPRKLTVRRSLTPVEVVPGDALQGDEHPGRLAGSAIGSRLTNRAIEPDRPPQVQLPELVEAHAKTAVVSAQRGANE
jgi:hypothetical protein